MKIVRIVLKSVMALIGIAVLVLLGLYVIPPAQEQFDYVRYTEPRPESELDKIGWYKSDDGKEYQVSFRATEGLQLNYFSPSREELKSLFLTSIDDEYYDTDNDLSTAEVTFTKRLIDTTWIPYILEVSTSRTSFRVQQVDSLHYLQQEISFDNNGLVLSGLLMQPYQPNGIGIVFIHGSGFSDRDNFWYMHQADYLAKRGFTVLLPDKRGCGRSEGEWHTSSFEDFAGDSMAAVEYLHRNHSDRIKAFGLLGLSQGAWISQVLQQDYNGLDFAIEVVGSAVTPEEQVEFEVMQDIKDNGVPGFLASPISLVFAKRARGKRKIWWEKNGNFDPVKTLAVQKIPVLRIYGMEDSNVPVERSLFRLDSLLTANPNLPINVHTFDGSGHGLMDPVTQWVREDYLDTVVYWILEEVNSE